MGLNQKLEQIAKEPRLMPDENRTYWTGIITVKASWTFHVDEDFEFHTEDAARLHALEYIAEEGVWDENIDSITVEPAEQCPSCSEVRLAEPCEHCGHSEEYAAGRFD